MKIILGIDPGLCVTGYGLLLQENNKLKYINSGCIRTKISELHNRLKKIYLEITSIICKFQPNCFAIEQVFVSNNANSALKLGQARGVAILAAINMNLPIFEYGVRQTKRIITGTGKADKNQIKNMVKNILNLSKKLQVDASDALAIAITHCYINKNI